MAFPAWGGAVGNAMMDAAIGYTNALLDKPKEEDEAAERKLKLEELRTRAELNRANAAWLERRQNAAGRTRAPIIKQLPSGEHVLYDENLADFVPIPGAKTRAPRALTPQQEFDRNTMDQIELQLGHPPPYTYEELQREGVAPLVDLLKQPRVYSGPTGYTTAEEIRDAFRNKQRVREVPGSGGQQPATPAQPPPADTAPRQPSAPPREPATSPPTTDPSLPSRPPPAARRAPAPTSGSRRVTGADVISEHVKYYTGKPEIELVQEFQKVSKRFQAKGSQYDKLLLDALAQVLHQQREGGGPIQGPPPPPVNLGKSSPSMPPETGPASTGESVPEQPETPPTSPTGKTVRTVETEGQRRDRELKEAEELRKQGKEDRALSDEERKQRSEARREALDLTGQFTNEQATIANKLFKEGKVRPETEGYYPLLNAEEKELVNALIRAPKLAKQLRDEETQQARMQTHHLKLLKEAKPYMDELQGLQATRKLVEQIIPLVKNKNIGLQASGRTLVGAVKSVLGFSSEYEKLVSEQITKQGLDPQIDELKARMLTQLVEMKDIDPKVKERLMNIAPQARLETLAAVIIYAHAMAVKRTFGQTERGLIGTDINFAEERFDPTKWISSPDVLLTNLGTLDRQIQDAVPILQNRIRMYYIDPATGKMLPGAPAGEREGASSAPATEDKLEILRGP